MKLLAIETSTEACSAALYSDAQVIERYQLAPGAHSRLILAMLEELFVESGYRLRDMDALAFGRGPGSFTGVRIAASVVQGLAYGADLPVVPVSTLVAVAQGAWSLHGWPQVLVAMDARMGEVYWGCYTCDAEQVMRAVHSEAVAAPERVLVPTHGVMKLPTQGVIMPPTQSEWHGAGSGWLAHTAALTTAVGAGIPHWDAQLLPRAAYLLPIAIAEYTRGAAVSAEFALPVYLRDQVARIPRS